MNASGWPRKAIGEIAQCSLGKMLDKQKNKGTLRPYLRNVNVRWFEFDLSDVLEMRFQEDEAERFTARKGDVLICEGGYPGRSAIWEDDSEIFFQKAIHRVRFHESERNRWFLYYIYFLEISGELRQYFTGTGIQHFTGQVLKRLDMPLPPLPEQQRIVGILDEAFAGIATAKANAETNLRNARDLFVSHLDSVFSNADKRWPERNVADIAEYSFGKMLDKTKNRGELEPYLRNINVRWFSVDTSDMLEMRFLPEESQKYTATRGDVLICEGGYPGRCAVWDRDEPVFFQKALHRVRFHNRSYNKWLVYYLYFLDESGHLREHFTGSGIQHFTGQALGRLTLPVPSPPDVEVLVRRFDGLQKEAQRLASLYQQKLAALDALKKSLLHQAFSGQLTGGSKATLESVGA